MSSNTTVLRFMPIPGGGWFVSNNEGDDWHGPFDTKKEAAAFATENQGVAEAALAAPPGPLTREDLLRLQFLKDDAHARAAGLNLDGSTRRETFIIPEDGEKP